MKVHNNSTRNEIRVSINKWGNDGGTSYYTIDKDDSESWDRTDPRGFVMAISGSSQNGNYYVQSNDDIKVYDHKVTINNTTIKKL